MKRYLLLLLMAIAVIFSEGESWASVQRAADVGQHYSDIFHDLFAKKIKAESLNVTVNGYPPELQKGHARGVYLCIRGVMIDGLRYDRLVVNLKNVGFTVSGEEVSVDRIGSSSITGSILPEDVADFVEARFPDLKGPRVTIAKSRLYIKGVYEKKYLIKIRALMRFYGRYYVDSESGDGILLFDDATNDNALVSAGDVARALGEACPRISFRNFLVSPKIAEIRIDSNMIWFTTKK